MPPVKILKKSQVKTIFKSLASDDIVLECELSRADAVTKWYKDNCRIQAGDERYCEEEEGTFRSLVILNAEPEDSGEYFLDVGDDSIGFQVMVEGRSCFLIHLHKHPVADGQTSYLKISWFRAPSGHCGQLGGR